MTATEGLAIIPFAVLEHIPEAAANFGESESFMTTEVKWSVAGDYYQVCSCDYGRPCEFEAPPTQGFCEDVSVWRIDQGNYGDVSLDGLGFGVAARWPQALHLGNGTAVPYFDERATPEQRDALLKIITGEAKGVGPFEIIITTLSNVLEPQHVPFQFGGEGRNVNAKMGDTASVAFEPIKNPVTGEEEGIRVDHDSGFFFKNAEVVSAKEMISTFGELNFSWPNKAGFVAKIKYGNS